MDIFRLFDDATFFGKPDHVCSNVPKMFYRRRMFLTQYNAFIVSIRFITFNINQMIF